MIAEIIATNKTLNTKYKFGQDLDCDYLYKDGGVDWGNVPATHNTYNYLNQVGDTVANTKIKNRDIYIEAYVYYIPTDDEKRGLSHQEIIDYAYSKIKEKKKKLNDFINPLHYIRLDVGDYYIEGKPSATPQYGVTYEDNNEYFCKFAVTIFCDNPMFKKNTETKNVLSGDVGAFHFPMIFQNNMDMIMGLRTNYLVILIENEGNVAVGGKIYLEAKGEIVNPRLENVLNGEFIQINKTLQEGEKIIINTSDGKNKGISGSYQGIDYDYLKYWNFDNTWLKFESGSTILGYSTENGSEESLNVYVEINPEKYGLEDM